MYRNIKEKAFIVIILLLVMVPQVSLASSVSLKSPYFSTIPGNTYTVSVYINPESVTSYTAEVLIDFPTDLVSVESFTYAPSWMPINQPGYDLVDNTNGKIIKTAGYPAGFNQETLLGTLVLKAKKAGTITLSTSQESIVLDSDGYNTLDNYGSSTITSKVPLSY